MPTQKESFKTCCVSYKTMVWKPYGIRQNYRIMRSQ